MIPNKSEASLKNGIWFIHSDNDNVVQIWGSNLNGKEKVYLNNELVSEQRNLKKLNSHIFKDRSGQEYEVKLEMESLMKGSLKCQILKDETTLAVFKTQYIKGKNFTFKKLLILVLVSFIFGVFASIYKLSNLYFIIFLILVLLIQFITRDHGEILVHQEKLSN